MVDCGMGTILASFCCAGLKLGVQELVSLELKLQNEDASINDDISELISNLHTYRTKDRKLILAYIKKFCDKNTISNSPLRNNSLANPEVLTKITELEKQLGILLNELHTKNEQCEKKE